jgi:SpoVK/Ycf46/Vps4 family AAA+-type ATPase
MVVVEVCTKQSSTQKIPVLRKHVGTLLEELQQQLEKQPSALLVDGQQIEFSSNALLAANVHKITLHDVPREATGAEALMQDTQVHIHRLYDEEVAEETTDDDEETVAFQMWLLPARVLDRLWENLLFEDNVKQRLLQYVTSAMLFASAGVDAQVVAWNRVILLHGPPGTGKTSLCKGLAHKLAIRQSHTYPQSHLIEVNAHSLFSKWFSESGKMVMAMFQKIKEILEDGDAFVCILIDEVESLTAARRAALSGNEPSDAVRVVNALLTQLDQLKRYKNALVLTTSNLLQAIDPAFVDRVDIKQYIGPPGVAARRAVCAVHSMA